MYYVEIILIYHSTVKTYFGSSQGAFSSCFTVLHFLRNCA